MASVSGLKALCRLFPRPIFVEAQAGPEGLHPGRAIRPQRHPFMYSHWGPDIYIYIYTYLSVYLYLYALYNVYTRPLWIRSLIFLWVIYFSWNYKKSKSPSWMLLGCLVLVVTKVKRAARLLFALLRRCVNKHGRGPKYPTVEDAGFLYCGIVNIHWRM